MADLISLFILSLLSYLLGSIPFSLLIARAYGKNLYQVGSGNIGAANVYRATKRPEAMLFALLGDAGKGILAILFAQGFPYLPLQGSPLAQAVSVFFVVMGHNWPIFLKFKGGKGLASLAGAILILEWKILLLALLSLAISILLTEMAAKKGIKFEGSFKEKLKRIFSIFISQVPGRVIGLAVASILVLIFFPQMFKILIGAAILSGVRHIKRTKDFLKKDPKDFSSEKAI